jgi:hydrogenase maturation protein HypF
MSNALDEYNQSEVAALVKRQRIMITGRVQGVGCRPFVYRIAVQLGLTGTVYNDTVGVSMELQGPNWRIDEFLTHLQSPTDKPPLLQITSCLVRDVPLTPGEKEFVVGTSDADGPSLSQVTADVATCADCLNEMSDKTDFRYHYPFINCTNCGPRYSIVKTIPYDRNNTTMASFQMCHKCQAQYTDISNRRFHAQPLACPACGPEIWLTDNDGNTTETDSEKAVAKMAQLLCQGKIVAIKGIGGFHLAVDALNEQAVQRLRQRKHRDHKPFAMMVASVGKIRQFAVVNRASENLLASPESPIVLLDKKAGNLIAPSVATGVKTFGFMLCYAPLHHLLFAEPGIEVLVMTSGNISDEPLDCENGRALENLANVADAFLIHNREIHRRVDDSVMYIIDGNPAFLRRSRGYVPAPILRDGVSPVDIFAAGADLKNTFCFVKGSQFILSEHIGDLANALVYHHYISSIEHLQKLFKVEPRVVVCDLHPGYLSTQYVHLLSATKAITVQHHWAHIASVLAEHNIAGPVIGLACDGTGYGTDGVIWGCECMIASLDDFERYGHLDYYELAGADKASKEAIRPVLGLLKKTYGDNFRLERFGWLLGQIEPSITKQRIILEQIEKQVNTVETSSLGRIFDAVAAMLRLGNYNHFDAQLPMALEAIAECRVEEHYDFELVETPDEPFKLDLSKMVRQLVADIQEDTAAGMISAKFHNCIAWALLKMAQAAREKTGLNVVALSGGVFCNRYLTNRLVRLLKTSEFVVLFNQEIPSNDGGISVGQAAIAAGFVKREV